MTDDGLILVHKEKNMTSHDVVNKIRKLFNTKKVGHLGTLDPNATGVLLIMINKGCKLIPLFEHMDKEYIGEVILGIETDTYDITGEIIKTSDVSDIKLEDINKALMYIKNMSEQKVPKYSAKKINGKKLYEYARNNIDVEIPTQKIKVYDIAIVSDLKYEKNCIKFNIKTSVSSGTYIRSIIYDIGQFLNVSSCMGDLVRTKQGTYNIEDSNKLSEELNIISIEKLLSSYNTIEVDEVLLKKIINGMKVPNIYNVDTCVFKNRDKLVAIYTRCDDDKSLLKMYKLIK